MSPDSIAHAAGEKESTPRARQNKSSTDLSALHVCLNNWFLQSAPLFQFRVSAWIAPWIYPFYIFCAPGSFIAHRREAEIERKGSLAHIYKSQQQICDAEWRFKRQNCYSLFPLFNSPASHSQTKQIMQYSRFQFFPPEILDCIYISIIYNINNNNIFTRIIYSRCSVTGCWMNLYFLCRHQKNQHN